MLMRALAAAMLLLGGCALFEPQADVVDRIVAEALTVARAPASGQKAALASAQAAFGKDTGDVNRLRLATLLAVLPEPLRDDARALELLGPVANPSSAGYGRFAALLSAQLMERQRLARELDRVARQRAEADKERDKREEELRRQLEAMQSIERGIIERQEKLRRQTPSVAPKR
jgi:septal ring factor EnvC (AmiA/AmiB activator)